MLLAVHSRFSPLSWRAIFEFEDRFCSRSLTTVLAYSQWLITLIMSVSHWQPHDCIVSRQYDSHLVWSWQLHKVNVQYFSAPAICILYRTCTCTSNVFSVIFLILTWNIVIAMHAHMFRACKTANRPCVELTSCSCLLHEKIRSAAFFRFFQCSVTRALPTRDMSIFLSCCFERAQVGKEAIWTLAFGYPVSGQLLLQAVSIKVCQVISR